MRHTYITTDTDVACSITIDKRANNISLTEYPKTYSLLESFTGYSEISLEEWQRMERSPREARIEAFKAYVAGVEDANVQTYQINSVYRDSEQEPGIPVENL